MFVQCLSQAAAFLLQAPVWHSGLLLLPFLSKLPSLKVAKLSQLLQSIMSLAPQCGAAVKSRLSGISVLHQAELNVAKQLDFSIRHRTLLRYRFVHVRRYHDSTCNALQPCPFLDTNRHRATASVRGHCAFRSRYGPSLDSRPPKKSGLVFTVCACVK